MLRPPRLPAILPFLLLASCGKPPATTADQASREGYLDAGGGTRLFYRLVGGGPDTVVVIHGGPGFTHDYFADDLEPMAKGHTLLFYDQRGTGRSSLVADSASLDAQRFAEDLEAIRSHFRLEQLTVLGHSWGAGVVALYAERFPDQLGQVIIVAGLPMTRARLGADFGRLEAGRDSATRQQMKDWMARRVADPGDVAACRAYYTLWFIPFFADSTVLGRTKGDFCAGTVESRRNKIEAVDRYTFASLGDWDWRRRLRGVPARTLVIHGTADVLTGAEEWAAAFRNGRLLLLEGVGHFPYLEAPDRFYPAVDAFLAGQWPEGARTIPAP